MDFLRMQVVTFVDLWGKLSEHTPRKTRYPVSISGMAFGFSVALVNGHSVRRLRRKGKQRLASSGARSLMENIRHCEMGNFRRKSSYRCNLLIDLGD